MDNRELKQYTEADTADADLCASKLQEWPQKKIKCNIAGSNVCLFYFGFYDISTFVGYLMTNPFLYK